MSKPVLAYWDIRCLAESIRLMLRYLEVDFEDKCYPTGDAPDYARPEWKRDKISLGFDFPNLPYWIDGDVKLTESWAITKYIARTNKSLYPQNDREEMLCDMLHGVIEDFRYKFINMCYSSNKEIFEKAKEKYLPNLIADLDKLETFLRNKLWLTGNNLLYVDFVFCETLDQIRLFKPDFLDSHHIIKKYLENFDNLKKVAEYRSSELYHAFPINSKYAYWGGKKA